MPETMNAIETKQAARIKAPKDDGFIGDYMADERLSSLAAVLIENCDELSVGCTEFRIEYLWKRTGGKSSGMVTLGKCNKLSGLAKYFGKTDFVIWLAADHCRDRDGINFAALMFHELMHIDQDEKGQPATRAHEFEGFSAEVARFGIWRESMRPIARAFQESLFPEEQSVAAPNRAAKTHRIRGAKNKAHASEILGG
jgi:hypothetical protein